MTYGPTVEGRGAPRLLRKRIHKRDGRVLEPDAAANAAQATAISRSSSRATTSSKSLEGWALPGDTGQLVIDTPDLLPERTSVREATIELRRATSIPFAIWSHPLLGKAEERIEGGVKVSVWRDEEPGAAPHRGRRAQDGAERARSASGRRRGSNVARAIEENVRSLDERDPLVKRWARRPPGADRQPSRALVERIVAAVGKKVKVASGGRALRRRGGLRRRRAADDGAHHPGARPGQPLVGRLPRARASSA